MNLLFFTLISAALCTEPSGNEAQTAVETQSPTTQTDSPTTLQPFDERLAEAKKQYFAGGHEAALAILQDLHERLEAGEQAGPALAEEVLLYLGEIEFKLGHHKQAWLIFEQLLQVNPNVSMSPYHHPTEVIAWFELVRRKVQQGQTQAGSDIELPMDPAPTWVYTPFGVPQFRNGQRGKGITYATLQGASMAASIGMYVHLKTLAADPDLSADELRTIKWQRFGVQWPITTLFYALWVHSAVQGRGAWRAAQQPGVTAGLTSSPASGTSIALTVTF